MLVIAFVHCCCPMCQGTSLHHEVCLPVKYLVCGNSLSCSETASCDCCMMHAQLVCVFTVLKTPIVHRYMACATHLFKQVCLTLWDGVCCVGSGPTVLPTTSLSCCGLLSDCQHRVSTVLPHHLHSSQHLYISYIYQYVSAFHSVAPSPPLQ